MYHRIFCQQLLLTVTLLLSLGAFANGEQKAAVCGACHGVDGNSINPAWPSLAGQGADYIVKQLQAYKSGSRQNGLMSPMAANLSDIDMIEMSYRYYLILRRYRYHLDIGSISYRYK